MVGTLLERRKQTGWAIKFCSKKPLEDHRQARERDNEAASTLDT